MKNISLDVVILAAENCIVIQDVTIHIIRLRFLLFILCRFWIDTADKQPCIGTGGMIAWKLRATGKLFHSGLPHKAFPTAWFDNK